MKVLKAASARGEYVRNEAARHPLTDLVISLTTQQLSDLVTQSVAGAVAKLVAEQQKEVLNLDECAALLQRTTHTVMKVLVKTKGLPVHFISEREPRFKRSQVIAWLDTLPIEAQPVSADACLKGADHG